MPDVIDNVKVGALIKKLLKERNMTQEQLAGLLNISKSAVSQNLNGRSSFDIQNLVKISEIFNISLDSLLSQKSGNNSDTISEYERLTKKGLDELKRVSVQELNIKEPDLYGKVLIEYVIEYENVAMFKYLHEADITLFNDYHHHAAKVLLSIIIFMLEKHIDGIEHYIYQYTMLYGAFTISDDEKRIKVMTLLNNTKHQVLVKRLMEETIIKETQTLKVIPLKQKYKVLTDAQWLETIALYRLDQVFSTYASVHDIYEHYPIIIKTFLEFEYDEGIHHCLDAMKKKALSIREHKRMKTQTMAYLIAKSGDLEANKKILDKVLYLNIDALVHFLIKEKQETLLRDVLNRESLVIDYVTMLEIAIEMNHLPLLKDYSHKLTQDQKNYLLSLADPYDFETVHYLICVGAEFVTKYHNFTTYTKVNATIKVLNQRDEGEKENE